MRLMQACREPPRFAGAGQLYWPPGQAAGQPEAQVLPGKVTALRLPAHTRVDIETSSSCEIDLLYQAHCTSCNGGIITCMASLINFRSSRISLTRFYPMTKLSQKEASMTVLKGGTIARQ